MVACHKEQTLQYLIYQHSHRVNQWEFWHTRKSSHSHSHSHVYSSHYHSHLWHICVPIPMRFPWESHGNGNPIPMRISSMQNVEIKILKTSNYAKCVTKLQKSFLVMFNSYAQSVFSLLFYRATQRCQRGLGSRNSVRPSVRLSHACFVTNPKNLPAIFLYHMKGQSSQSNVIFRTVVQQ